MHGVTIPGPEGRLEARYNKGNGLAPPLALFCITSKVWW